MAEGIDKKVASEAMSLEPSQILEFYLIYFKWPEDQNSVLALTPLIKSQSERIIWQRQEYIAYPMETSGFEVKGDNSLPRPRLKFSNIEFGISLEAAKMAFNATIPHACVISAKGVNHKIWGPAFIHPLFYMKIMGKKEQTILNNYKFSV